MDERKVIRIIDEIKILEHNLKKHMEKRDHVRVKIIAEEIQELEKELTHKTGSKK